MRAVTPLEHLFRARRGLRWTIELLRKAQSGLGEKPDSWMDVIEVEKVLRHTVDQLSKIIRREDWSEEKPRNDRPGADLALKAKLAKVRGAVAKVLKEREDEHSHK